MVFLTASTEVLVALVLTFFLMRTSDCWMVADFHLCSQQFRTVFIPKSNTVDNQGRIVRPPDALLLHTLCAIVNVKFTPRRSAMGISNVQSPAFTLPPGKRRTRFLRLTCQPLPSARACLVIQVA